MYMVACMAAWPLSQARRGVPTAFRPTVEEAVWGLPFPHIVYAVKIFITMLFADAHTFWKHYLLHRPSVYAFHKYHHQFHNVCFLHGLAHIPNKHLPAFLVHQT